MKKYKLTINELNVLNAPEKILAEHIYQKLSIKRDQYIIYIVWNCKTLQNRKWILSTNLPDHKLYELTYNGDKNEYYLDEYDKVSNTVITPIQLSDGE